MHALGALAVAGAGLAWSIDNNLSQRLSLRDPVAVTRVKTLVAGTVNVVVALAMGDHLPGAVPLAGALATGFFGYGVSIVLPPPGPSTDRDGAAGRLPRHGAVRGRAGWRCRSWASG